MLKRLHASCHSSSNAAAVTTGAQRSRDLEVTYTPAFTDIVHELRGHIGAMRQPTHAPAGATS